jgi:hypothetical protein
MSNLTEDDRIKAFVEALALGLQNIVGKPPETTRIKRRSRKHKKADSSQTKRADHKS